MTVYGLDRNQWHQVIAAWSGWLMDGYISISYLFVAVIIAPILFPATYIGLVATVGGFVIGAVARFVGSIVLGDMLGDRIGRKYLLIVSVIGFSVFSASIGLLPTYTSVGLIAPVALYILMFVTGMFAGAEYGGGTALSMESVPPERRGFVGSFVQSGYGTGYFAVALVFALVSSHFNMTTIGWRLMFYLTLIPGILILLVRLSSKETPVFEEMTRSGEIESLPIWKMIRESWRPVLVGLLITNALLYINTSTFGFWPIFLPKYAHISSSNTGVYLAIVNFVSLIGVWSGGALANVVKGRRRPLLAYSAVFTLLMVPLTLITLGKSPLAFVTAMSVVAFSEAMIFATMPAFLAESFSKRYRVTATGFVYNGGALIGSFAALNIVAYTLPDGSNLGTIWLINLIVACIALLVGTILARETWISGKDKITN